MKRSLHSALGLLLASACLAAGQAAAQPAPLGPEVRVDTLASLVFPNCPDLAVQRDGSFEIVWTYGGSEPESIYSRHFEADLQPTDSSQVLLLLLSDGILHSLVDDVVKTQSGFDVLWHLTDHSGDLPARYYHRSLDKAGKPGARTHSLGASFAQWVWPGLDGTWIEGWYAYRNGTISIRWLAPNGRPMGAAHEQP